MRPLYLLAGALALAGMAMACGGSDSGSKGSGQEPRATATQAPPPTPTVPTKAVIPDVTSKQYLATYSGPKIDAKIVSAGIDQYEGIGQSDAPVYVTDAITTEPVRGSVRLDKPENSAWVLFTWKYEGVPVLTSQATPDSRGWAFSQLSPSFGQSGSFAAADTALPFGNYELEIAVVGSSEARTLPVSFLLRRTNGTPFPRPAKATFASAAMAKAVYTPADKNIGPSVKISASAWVTETVLYNGTPLFTRSAGIRGGDTVPANLAFADSALDKAPAGKYQVLLTLPETGETKSMDFTVEDPVAKTGPLKMDRTGVSLEPASDSAFCKTDASRLSSKVFSGQHRLYAVAIPSTDSPTTWSVTKTRIGGLVLPQDRFAVTSPASPVTTRAGSVPGNYEVTIASLTTPPAVTTLQYSVTHDKAQFAKLLDVGIVLAWDGCGQPPLVDLNAPIVRTSTTQIPLMFVAIKLGPGAEDTAKIELTVDGALRRGKVEAGGDPFFLVPLRADG